MRRLLAALAVALAAVPTPPPAPAPAPTATRGGPEAWERPVRRAVAAVDASKASREIRERGLAAYDFGPGTTGALCRHLL